MITLALEIKRTRKVLKLEIMKKHFKSQELANFISLAESALARF